MVSGMKTDRTRYRPAALPPKRLPTLHRGHDALVRRVSALAVLGYARRHGASYSIDWSIDHVDRSGAIAAAAVAFFVTTAFLDWKARPAEPNNDVVIIRPITNLPGPIEVIDGDTVRQQGFTYRLVGFDTPERGDRARC